MDIFSRIVESLRLLFNTVLVLSCLYSLTTFQNELFVHEQKLERGVLFTRKCSWGSFVYWVKVSSQLLRWFWSYKKNSLISQNQYLSEVWMPGNELKWKLRFKRANILCSQLFGRTIGLRECLVRMPNLEIG